jgi:hypothetical protein
MYYGGIHAAFFKNIAIADHPGFAATAIAFSFPFIFYESGFAVNSFQSCANSILQLMDILYPANPECSGICYMGGCWLHNFNVG